jgi:hypothetical protein
MKNLIFQIHLLVLFALLLPSQVQSQITSCDDPANPLLLQVREIHVDSDLADDCFLLAYEVYFLANDSSTETAFLAKQLSLIGQINSSNGRQMLMFLDLLLPQIWF